MVLNYLKDEVSRETIIKAFSEVEYDINFSRMPTIALIAKKLGFDPFLVLTNYSYLPAKLNELESTEIIEYLRGRIDSGPSWIDDDVKLYYGELIKYLDLGGRVEFRFFTAEDLLNSLGKNKPCIAQINSASFSKKDLPFMKQHFVVVIGEEGGEMIMNSGHEEPIRKEIKDFMFSLYRVKIPNLLLF